MKNEIFQTALENLFQAVGIEGFWQENGPLDGIIDLEVNGTRYTFVVVLKHEVRPHQIPQMELYYDQHEDFMLVASLIFPKVKAELRQKGIPYLETCGNIFLQKGNIYLFADTQKTISTGKAKSNRAFTKTGLKVLFYLLQNKEHINLTHRTLAEKTGVGLGNIPQIVEGLKKTGFIVPLNKNTYVWENRRILLDRWITEYGGVLKPNLKKERYKFKGNWQELPLNHELTVWGGEPAADILTNHLRPEKYLLYTRENRASLIKNYRLIPDQQGEIEVLEMFWKQDMLQPTAPAILVYADLMLEGGKRIKETAEIIFDEHIKPKL